MRASGIALLVAMAAIGGFIAGMMWLANSTPQVGTIDAYCRGNIEGYHMARSETPTVAEMELAEETCRENIRLGLDFGGHGYRGPLVP